MMGTLAESSQATSDCQGAWTMELCQAECPDSKRRRGPEWHLPQTVHSHLNPLLDS